MLKKSLIIIGCICLLTISLASEGWSAEKINYRLKWLFNTSVVGDLYADVNGYFSRNGLDVTVKAGGPERDAIRELELGHAQFGVASADQVIRARTKGAPVVVLAQLFQVNPLQWIYRTTKPPVKTLDDLKGRVIGITFGGNDESIMRTLLAKGKISEKEVTLFSVRYDLTPFLKDKADIWPVYRNSQGPVLIQKLKGSGESLAFFNPADYGVNFVANSVVTSEKMLKESPETVKKFTQALLEAWEAALAPENEQKALTVLAQFDKETAPAIQKEQLDITRQQIKPTPETVIGHINTDAWKQTEEIMLEQKLIPGPVSIEKALIIN